jgi:hypothetical protein
VKLDGVAIDSFYHENIFATFTGYRFEDRFHQCYNLWMNGQLADMGKQRILRAKNFPVTVAHCVLFFCVSPE